MNYRLRHLTRYAYSDQISLSHNEARLAPQDGPGQVVRASRIRIEPEPLLLHERKDFFGNRVHYFTIDHPHKSLEVTMECQVDVTDGLPPLPDSPSWEEGLRLLRKQPPRERQFSLESPLIQLSQGLHAFAEPAFAPGRPLLEAAEALSHHIFETCEFVPDFTDVTTPLSEVLKHRSGVCQDFAQLAIGCLRARGLAARYVSGYIETLPPPGQEKLVGSDASHAWFSVLVPGLGWFEFDPTNDQRPSGRHIRTATGRDFTDATPLKGVIYGGRHSALEVEVDVTAIESPT